MSYQTLPLKITGGEYKSRSPAWSNQSLVNMYIDQQNSGRTADCLMPWPGETLFSESEAGYCRGFYNLDGVLYSLFDRNLYRVQSDGVSVKVGEIPGGSRVSITDDGQRMFIRIEGTCAYINNKIILQGNGLTYVFDPFSGTIEAVNFPSLLPDEFVVSDAGNTTVFRDTFKAPANLSSDALMQVYVFQQKVIMLGETSLQFFQDVPAGPTPTIVPIQQASTTSVGTVSQFSAANTPNFFYFLGHDNSVYRISSYLTESISNSSISKQLRGLEFDIDAIGFTCQLDGQWFYILQFPASFVTLAFSEQTGEWLRLSSGTGKHIGAHTMRGVQYVYGKLLIAGAVDGKVYEWDYDKYDSAYDDSLSTPIIRQFDTAPINGMGIGAPGRRLFCNKIVLIMESGVGNLDQPNPKVMCSVSTDGGRSFTNEDWVEIGRGGDGGQIVEFYVRESFYDLVLRVRVSDPNFICFHAATIDVKDGGQ